ncbi:MAG TPA: hypothetical protein VHP83_07350 [Aggregatilineaceae bacterium]|nr:hypothetical protein [Aggregatilineaceae bacterium]
MGIKLDWQVESENSQTLATEDLEGRKRRHRARARLLVLVLLVVCLFGAVVGSIVWRWHEVEDQFKQDLLDTVEVERTALRIGDYDSFLAVQRTISDPFKIEQGNRYTEYQNLKRQNRIDLTRPILDSAIRERTGRVVLEEVKDGIAYQTVWFYWYYEDGDPEAERGWRRVPDDLEFWGDSNDLERGSIRITYRDLDEGLAKTLAPRLNDWWTNGCVLLQCTTALPTLHLEIVAARPMSVEWSTNSPATLRMTSPLLASIISPDDERARVDNSIPPAYARLLSDQLAQRIVRHATNNLAPITNADAAWFQLELARWLAAVYQNGPSVPDTGFTGALVAQYGPTIPAILAHTLLPDTTLDQIMIAATGLDLAALSPDQLNTYPWQGYFQWRLDLESRLLRQANGGGLFLALYDLETPGVSDIAQQRASDPAYSTRPVPQVTAVTITRDANGQTFALVDTTRTDGSQTISELVQFRLSGGTWKRLT